MKQTGGRPDVMKSHERESLFMLSETIYLQEEKLEFSPKMLLPGFILKLIYFNLQKLFFTIVTVMCLTGKENCN